MRITYSSPTPFLAAVTLFLAACDGQPVAPVDDATIPAVPFEMSPDAAVAARTATMRGAHRLATVQSRVVAPSSINGVQADIINSPEGGDSKGKTGTYFGLWALATKLATAIGAAGSLPVAALLGFNPAKGLYGTTALIIAYIVLPVMIKIGAALLIWFIRIEAVRGSVRDELLGHRLA